MLRVAIKGAGNWGKRLIGAVHGKSAKIAFTTAVTRNPSGRQDLSDGFGLKLTIDYAAVLADPAIHAVVLATPHSQHAAEIIAAAKAGKHVFAEKPFTLTRADAEAALAACEAAGVTLLVGFNRRFAPAYVEMSRRIAAGEIGSVRHIEGQFSGPGSYQTAAGNWRSNQTESPGGAMTARGVHVIDGMVALAGPINNVFANSLRQVHEIDVDDTTSCLLRFAKGATGYLGTLHAATPFYRLHVFGSNGALEMRGETELIATDLAGKVERFTFDLADKERAVLEAFADAVAASVKFPIPKAEIINTGAVTEAVAQSAKSGKAVAIA
ncbi:MAG TPA: Gfo/Idh/MocA family oxidoreductase [Pseudolabrys sp.]|nr:Gfo/Idh/MocA family oxidoreductase [Pseudolabrys sp.]